MPPKKKDDGANAPPVLMGRVGASLKIGIVGLPNVGKSTFFNVLTKSTATAENFPFCTIDPNESRVPVPDARWDFLCENFQPASKVPAFLKVVDIAGLVKGAHEGKGLGNAFLSNINACDAIFHVVRAFSDEEIIHVEGDVDPSRDLTIIHDELRLKDLEYIGKNIGNLEKNMKRDKKLTIDYETIKKVQDELEKGKWVRNLTFDAKEIEIVNQHLFLTAKPVIYLVNLSVKDYIRKKNKWLVKIKDWIDANDRGAMVILFSGQFESDLLDKETPEEKEKFLKESEAQSALEKIIVNGYKSLGLIYFFTCGKDEVKAWTIQKNTKAPQAAGRIHSDMEKGFIMAEVMAYEDFKEAGSEANCKAAGKYKQKGRDYVVEDGDIIFFKFNAGAGLSAAKKK